MLKEFIFKSDWNVLVSCERTNETGIKINLIIELNLMKQESEYDCVYLYKR